MFWVIVGFLGILTLGLLLLIAAASFPVSVDFRIDRHEATYVSINALLFNGNGPAIRVFDSRRPRKKKPQEKRKRSKDKKTNRHIARNAASEVYRLASSLLRLIEFERICIDADIGLGDPAETGQLFGFLTPLIYGVGADVSVRPVFDRACLDGMCEATFKVTPVALLQPFARFGWQVFGPVR